MTRNEHLDLAIDELEKHGLSGEVSERGKHLELAWITPQGRRFVIAPKTPSDWRGGMNLRRDVRKLLRADNMQPKVISNLSFQRAMSLPKVPVISQDLLLQKDLNELTDFVFDLQSRLAAVEDQNKLLIEKMNLATVVSRIEFGPQSSTFVIKPEPNKDLIVEIEDKIWSSKGSLPFRESSIQGEIFACLTTQYEHINDIVKKSCRNSKYVSTTLSKAKKLGFAELGLRGQWRKKNR